MNLSWDKDSWEDYIYWQQTDKAVLRRINELIKECLRTPFEGKGKPEPLKENLSGYWSRRITDEHRLVYRVEADRLHIIQCRYHYWLVMVRGSSLVPLLPGLRPIHEKREKRYDIYLSRSRLTKAWDRSTLGGASQYLFTYLILFNGREVQVS